MVATFIPDIGDRVMYTLPLANPSGLVTAEAIVIGAQSVVLQTPNPSDNIVYGPLPGNAPAGSVTADATSVVFDDSGNPNTAVRIGGSLRAQETRYNENRILLHDRPPNWAFVPPERNDVVRSNIQGSEITVRIPRNEAGTWIALDVSHPVGTDITVTFYEVLTDGTSIQSQVSVVNDAIDPVFRTVVWNIPGADKEDPAQSKVYAVVVTTGAPGGAGSWNIRYLRSNGGDAPP